MADILCPNCGMPNTNDQNVCSFCRQPLFTTKDSSSIRPGDLPTKKITAELEPILPGWLRDARENARLADKETAAEEAKAAAEQPAPKVEAPRDWLAGLEATSREEEQEEIPEWMRGSSGAPPQAMQNKVEDTFPRRQEIRWEEEPSEEETDGLAKPVATSEAESSGLPAWMRGMEDDSTEEKEEVSDWLAKKTDAPQGEAAVSPFAKETFNPSTGELANWLDRASSEKAAPAPADPSASRSEALPWDRTSPAAQPTEAPSNWLSNLPRESTEKSAPPAQTSIEADILKWSKEETPAEIETFSANLDLPDWMKPLAEENQAPRSDWMKEHADTPATPKESEAPQPDWMAAFRVQDQKAEFPAPITESATPPSAPAFFTGEDSFESNQVDELFAIEMPDWLSNIGPTEQKSAPATLQETPQESIAPAELPSWVQAMRPVETALPSLETALPTPDRPLENQGPLAGLRGVLPAAPEFTPSGKPKAYSIRLQTTESQQANASLLEQMLASETQAKPISTSSTFLSQRVLRRVIAVLMLLLVTFTLLAGTEIISLPANLPGESGMILPVLEALPEGAPALLIFDYEPALAGELEASAAPFVDHLIGYRHPRLTILSTSPTGAALAERFMATTQSRHNYIRGQNYINLGYLPGGSAGILSFAENPHKAMPFDAAWNSTVAQGVNQFSDYAVVILLTDQSETARAWIEQTAARRKGHPLLIVSSAQAAPMIQPYLLSGQVNGLVNGLHGGAAFGQVTGFSSLVRRYWDTYNLSTLFAAMLIVVGGLWNFTAGVRARQQGLEEV
jgi:hypothetical protein